MKKRTRADIFDYQEEVINIIKDTRGDAEYPHRLFQLDVGRGKSTTIATGISETFPSYRVLVVAPPNVVTNTWPAEFDEWDHLSHLWCEACEGTPEQRKAVIEGTEREIKRDGRKWPVKGKAPWVAISYQNYSWLLEGTNARRSAKPPKHPFEGYGRTHDFDIVVFDEVQHLIGRKNTCFELHQKWRHRFKHIFGMTGTTFTEGIERAYGYAKAIEPKGFPSSFKEFRGLYMMKVNNFHWIPEPHAVRKISELMAPWFTVVNTDHMPLPCEAETRYYRLTMPPEAKEKYDTLENEQVLELLSAQEAATKATNAKTSDAGKLRQIAATQATVLKQKLQQGSQGFFYTTPRPGEMGEKEPIWFTDFKFEALEQLLESLEGEQVIIVYWYASMLEKLKSRSWPGLKRNERVETLSGVSKEQSRDIVKRWNEGKIRLLACQPQAVAEGINLQKGGAHHMIWCGLTWSAEQWQQMRGRLIRTGQIAPRVYIHVLCARGTVDIEMEGRLRGKLKAEDDIINSVVARSQSRQAPTE